MHHLRIEPSSRVLAGMGTVLDVSARTKVLDIHIEIVLVVDGVHRVAWLTVVLGLRLPICLLVLCKLMLRHLTLIKII